MCLRFELKVPLLWRLAVVAVKCTLNVDRFGVAALDQI